MLLVVVLLGAWLAYRAAQASQALYSAQDGFAAMQKDLDDGGTDNIEQQLPGGAGGPRDGGPRLPRPRLAGRPSTCRSSAPNLAGGARSCRRRCDDLTTDALPAVSKLNAVLNIEGARGEDGRVDLAPLVDAGPQIIAAADERARGAGRGRRRSTPAPWSRSWPARSTS